MSGIAHISDSDYHEPIEEHLERVARYARECAKPMGLDEMAYVVGWMHDIGKNSTEFQDRILRNGPRVEHSAAGGYELWKLHDIMGSYITSGHHGGVPNGGTSADPEDGSSLHSRILRARNGNIPDYSGWEELIPQGLLDNYHPTYKRPVKLTDGDALYTFAFQTRMLLSCLCDSDWLATEYIMRDKHVPQFDYDSIETLYNRMRHIYTHDFANPDEGSINELRNSIADEILASASKKPGFFTLAAGTGFGKTESSMQFALAHALKHGFKRVIYGIPYTAIIDENGLKFGKYLGAKNVLMHYGSYDYGQNTLLERASENWDAPVVVTTNNQFFESLYTSLVARGRKLHNIANSVIVLDEVQSIPTGMVKACIRSLIELVYNYGCSVVLCSATQPPLKEFVNEYDLPVRPLLKNSVAVNKRMKRVTYKNGGTLSNEELVAKLSKEDKVLCIVNSKKQAQDLYKMMPKTGLFHLSTSMYPANRKDVIGKIKNALSKDGEEGICRVISTSVIEAGVDLDFPTVYRANAGLDSIIQAAGRCNRNAERKAENSFVIVFDTKEKYTIPKEVEQRRAITNQVLNGAAPNDKQETLARYFKILYNERDLDASNVLADLTNPAYGFDGIPFRDVSKRMHLIEEATFPIICPDKDIKPIIADVEAGKADRKALRKLEQYTVSVYETTRNRLIHHIRQINEDDERPMYVLESSYLYSNATGLRQF